VRGDLEAGPPGLAGAAPTIYHGTPFTPRAALLDILPGRAAFVSFYRPDDVDAVEQVCAQIGYDHGGASFWFAAMRLGQEWDEADRQGWWRAYYAWLEPRLQPGRWALLPDSPGAPSQINDALLYDWPFGPAYGVPVWHMDGPLQRLGRLCERYDKVALGWIGDPKKEQVGCPRYRERMEEIDAFFGNRWHPTHMLRGIKVAFDYPFDGADSTSLAQNGHLYDSPFDALWGDRWRGRRAYADALERKIALRRHRPAGRLARRSDHGRGDPPPPLGGGGLLDL
jgi:hypothetical protein